MTLIDRALLAPKYPATWIASLMRRKVSSRLFDERDPLHAVVQEVMIHYRRPPRLLMHQLRYLLESGQDPNRRGGREQESPLHTFLTWGYTQAESDFPFFVQMFELFLAHGLTDHKNSGGTRLSAVARQKVDNGQKHYGALVDILRRAPSRPLRQRSHRGA